MADVNPTNPWMVALANAVGPFLGASAAIVSGLITQWMTAGREREAKERDAKHQRERERVEFQVKALIELKEFLLGISESLGMLQPDNESNVSYIDYTSKDHRSNAMAIAKVIRAHALAAVIDNSAARELTVQLCDKFIKFQSYLSEEFQKIGSSGNKPTRDQIELFSDGYSTKAMETAKMLMAANAAIGDAIRELHSR